MQRNGRPTKKGKKTEKRKNTRPKIESKKRKIRRKEINRIQPVIETGLRNRIRRP